MRQSYFFLDILLPLIYHFAMLYREPVTLSFPQELYNDNRLSWTDRIAWVLIVKLYSKNADTLNTEIEKELALSPRRLREIKSKLASFGYLAKIGEGKGAKYLPIDPASKINEKLTSFRRASTQGFKSVPESELLLLQSRCSLDKILYTMEVLEWTYRKSEKKSIGKPLFLLKRCLKLGVTPDADFKRGFWHGENEKRDAVITAKAAIEKKELDTRSERIGGMENFRNYLDGITEQERDALRSRAIHRIKANGGLHKIGQEMQINIAMKAIFEEAQSNA